MPSAHRKDVAGRGFTVFLLASLLAACGGGGGGSGSSTQSPTTQPPMPQPVYAGTKNQGTLDLATAQNYSQEVFAAFNLLNSVGNEWSQNVNGLLDASGTHNGSVGGTVTITGGGNADRSIWAEETFDNYVSSSDPGTVLNGSIIVHQNPPQSGVNFAGTVGADHYVAKVGDFTYEYDGTFTYSFTNGGYKMAGDFSVGIGSAQILASGITLTEENITGQDGSLTSPFSYSGRIYDSGAGYLDVSTALPVSGGIDYPTIQSDIYPEGNTGEVILSGAGNTVLHFEPLNGFLAYLGLDTGNGQIDYGARIDRATGAIDATQPTGTSVQALTELPTPATHVGAITVDGRYSYTPGGGSPTTGSCSRRHSEAP